MSLAGLSLVALEKLALFGTPTVRQQAVRELLQRVRA